ncbi:MAG: S41 family peptidase, partial [Acidobacteria bacterium]|nr:S41 family peptidase [Acidobacteriota bacterium]
ERTVTVLPDVVGRIVSPGIGYLRVEAFPEGAPEQIAILIQELRESGAEKFVLDLRDNASGEIEEAIGTANLFLKRGLISYLSGQQYPRRSFIADPNKSFSEEPLVVLVNQFSGGGAEVLAAAIMDNRRGDVVGEKTYGIGAIQKLIPMDDGSALILSIAKYFTPAGKEIQGNGITPNVLVDEEREFVSLSGEGEEPAEGEEPPAPQQPREDAPFKRGIELLNAIESQLEAA